MFCSFFLKTRSYTTYMHMITLNVSERTDIKSCRCSDPNAILASRNCLDWEINVQEFCIMEWFKSFTAKPEEQKLPPVTPLQIQRAKQIESLRVFHQSVAEIQKDAEYRLTVHLANSTVVYLHIQLPPMFPQEKPIVRVSPAVYHPWVNDQNTIIGCPGINNFVMHSDLSRVIKDIIEEFNQNVPILKSKAGQVPYGAHQEHSTPHTTQAYMSSQSTAPSYMTQVPMPSIPAGISNLGQIPTLQNMFPQFRDMSKDQLQSLLENEDEQICRLMDTAEVKKLATDREAMCRVNEALARENLARQPLLEEKKQKLIESWEELTRQKEEFDKLAVKQEKELEELSPSTLRMTLQVAVMQAEEQSDDIANEFLNGKISIQEFMENFMKVRTLHHLRRTKEEKLSQTSPHGF